MAQLLIKRENVQSQPKPQLTKTEIADWDSFLYSYWLQKIALNPGLYDDAKKSHMLGRCSCKICGQDHSPVTIGLEHGGFITTTVSALRSNTKAKKNKIADRYLSPDIFWPEEEGY